MGYAHSGWGLQPLKPTFALPNYEMPAMDGIGANEYIVTVVHNAIDFFSAGDTSAPWELNMWYHTLNAGFRTRLSGETDFPCIFDERVGLARSYFKPEGTFSYDSYTDALRKGRGYVSEGSSHILDFAVNGTEVGTANSEVSLKGKSSIKVTARVAAFLPEKQTEGGAAIARRPLDEQPYWHIERARDGKSRNVKVELIVNGFPVDSKVVPAEGSVHDVQFDHTIVKSAWVALRVYPSSHTNPIFIKIDNKPILDVKSAKWCRDALDQCWKQKEPAIRSSEKAAAKAAYDAARKVYDSLK